MSELPVLLIKSRTVSFFLCTRNTGARGIFFFTLKMPSYLLMSSAGYLTAGFACFCCNIWQPSSTDSFNVKVFFYQTEPEVYLLSLCSR